MRYKHTIKLMVFILIVSLALPSVFSWGPYTHKYILEQALKQVPDSNYWKQMVEKYPNACYKGLIAPDVAVYHYLTNFKIYQGTHNWIFYDRMMQIANEDNDDQLRTFAFCTGLHLAMDSISHNYFVPANIRHSIFGTNILTHAAVEEKVDNQFRTSSRLNAFKTAYAGFGLPNDKYCNLISQASGTDFHKECSWLAYTLAGGDFYRNYGKPIGYSGYNTFIGKLSSWSFHSFMNIVNVLVRHPVDEKQDLDFAIKRSVNFFENHYTRQSPSGIESLRRAEHRNKIFLYSVGFSSLALVLYLKWRRRK